MKNGKRYLFHPYEIAFSGFSGSGKTTLIEKLMKRYSKNFSVAFIKHDIHKFDMDKPGKDTYRIYHSGATATFISSKNGTAYLSKKKRDDYNFNSELTRYDIVVIEGYKDENTPKYLLTTLEKLSSINFSLPKYKNLLGIIIDQEFTSISIDVDIPIFHRDDIDSIYNHSIKQLKKRLTQKLNAIILVGGRSKRMGYDKSLIDYNGKPQAEYIYKMIEPLVDNIFISSREDQNSTEHLQNLNYINDIIPNIGPLGGIISAMLKDRDSAWLVVACDLPFITKETIKQLIKKRNPFKTLTSFKGGRGFEPLIAIYEPKSFNALINGVTFSQYSIRKLLSGYDKNILDIGDSKELKNINRVSDLERTE